MAVSNPDKVVFPDAHVTKLDLINYYRSVADGALRGVYGRPMILKRFVKGISAEAIFQKRAPEKRPDYVDVAELKYRSGTSAKEAVLRDTAGLAWAVNLGCVDLNPHPVRAEDLDHPDELRVDLDPMPGVGWSQIVDVAQVAREVLEEHGLDGVAQDFGLARLPHLRAHPPEVAVHQGSARRRNRGPGGGATRSRSRDGALVEGRTRHPGLRRLQPERQGPHGGLGLLGTSHARCPGFHAAALGRGRRVPSEAFTVATVPDRFTEIGDPWEGMDITVGELDPLLALAKELGPAEKAAEGRLARWAKAIDHAPDRDRQDQDQG